MMLLMQWYHLIASHRVQATVHVELHDFLIVGVADIAAAAGSPPTCLILPPARSCDREVVHGAWAVITGS